MWVTVPAQSLMSKMNSDQEDWMKDDDTLIDRHSAGARIGWSRVIMHNGILKKDVERGDGHSPLKKCSKCSCHANAPNTGPWSPWGYCREDIQLQGTWSMMRAHNQQCGRWCHCQNYRHVSFIISFNLSLKGTVEGQKLCHIPRDELVPTCWILFEHESFSTYESSFWLHTFVFSMKHLEWHVRLSVSWKASKVCVCSFTSYVFLQFTGAY